MRLRISPHSARGDCAFALRVRKFEAMNPAALPTAVRSSTRLDPDQQALIRRSDTLFIGSFYATGGADASHRGGAPGFVQVLSPCELLIPDYRGNCMFQTLGNIAMNPGCGLLFPDFATGRTLQLSGTAAIVWDALRLRQYHGAERAVEFRVHKVIDTAGANRLRWQFIGPSRFNPA